jgi:hypothetical protein
MGAVEHQPRLVDTELRDRLQGVGAVLLRGPKACGKTETDRQQANSEIQIDNSPLALTAMASDPAYLLQGATPRLIDEWQEQLPLWNAVRHEVDRRRIRGPPRPAPRLSRRSWLGLQNSEGSASSLFSDAGPTDALLG